MPIETKDAVAWALKQYEEVEGYKAYVVVDGDINHHLLVDLVSKYFKNNNIKYGTFSFNDLKPYL